MSVRPYDRKVIDKWSPDLSVRQRAASLGWIGPFTNQEYALLTDGYAGAVLYASRPEPLSHARLALRDKYAGQFHEARERVAESQATWDDVLAEAMRRAVTKDIPVGWLDEKDPGWQRARRALEEKITDLAVLQAEFELADRRLVSDETPRR